MSDVRPAVASDADAVAAVARASWHAAYDAFLGPETVADIVADWYAVADLGASIDTADCFRVATADGDVVGFVHAVDSIPDGTVDPALRPANAGFVARLYVHPDHWRRGVGTRLLDHAETWLADRGVDAIALEVFAANDAGRGFYEARGYAVAGEQDSGFGAELVLVKHD